ncbi:MAG: TSUP family transporter [Geminicoccaceae bacterium]
MFTTGISGLSHRRDRIDRRFVRRLALPGMAGGAAGAHLLTTPPGDAIAPFVSVHLLLMGAWIVWRATRNVERASEPPPGWVAPLGVGGGTTPRLTIGSVNFAEFFVTMTISITFLGTIGLELWPIIARPDPWRSAGRTGRGVRRQDHPRAAADDPGRCRHHATHRPRPGPSLGPTA